MGALAAQDAAGVVAELGIAFGLAEASRTPDVASGHFQRGRPVVERDLIGREKGLGLAIQVGDGELGDQPVRTRWRLCAVDAAIADAPAGHDDGPIVEPSLLSNRRGEVLWHLRERARRLAGSGGAPALLASYEDDDWSQS